jgi:hypothetical protein
MSCAMCSLWDGSSCKNARVYPSTNSWKKVGMIRNNEVLRKKTNLQLKLGGIRSSVFCFVMWKLLCRMWDLQTSARVDALDEAMKMKFLYLESIQQRMVYWMLDAHSWVNVGHHVWWAPTNLRVLAIFHKNSFPFIHRALFISKTITFEQRIYSIGSLSIHCSKDLNFPTELALWIHPFPVDLSTPHSCLYGELGKYWNKQTTFALNINHQRSSKQ